MDGLGHQLAEVPFHWLIGLFGNITAMYQLPKNAQLGPHHCTNIADQEVSIFGLTSIIADLLLLSRLLNRLHNHRNPDSELPPNFSSLLEKKKKKKSPTLQLWRLK